MSSVDRQTLLDRLTARSAEDLREIVFRLGLDWDELGGPGTAKTPRAIKLVEYHEEHAALADLYAALADLERDPAHRHAVPLSRERRNELALLHKVRAAWVHGVLDQSLYAEARLALGLETRPDAVIHGVKQVVYTDDQAPHPLPPDTRVSQVFDDAGGHLLILGAPGSGKTTLLLELARDLITRAARDEGHSLPVVFNLSTWATRRLPLPDWLTDELNLRYDIPRAIAEAWVKAERVLPLLDGLDEVQADARSACLAAINDYRRDHGLVPLVVCSRLAEFEALHARLKLDTAVLIQPLTVEQVDAYLAGLGERAAGLRDALAADPDLRALADTPLLLSILLLTYHDQPAAAILADTEPGSDSGSDSPPLVGEGPGERSTPASPPPMGEGLGVRVLDTSPRRTALFGAYVARMFDRPGRSKDARYPRQQTLHWLAYLAHTLQGHAQSVFYLERLQPDWLPSPATRRQYSWLDRLTWPLVFMPVFGLAGHLLGGLLGAVVGGLLGVVWGGWLSSLASGAILVEQVHWSWTTARQAVRRRLGSRLIMGVIVGVVVGGAQGQVDGGGGAMNGLLLGGVVGVVVGEILDRIFGRAALRWFEGLAVGMYLGWIVGTEVRSGSGFAKGLVVGLSEGVTLGVIAELINLLEGLEGGEVESRGYPNQGILRSLQNAIVFGLGAGLFSLLIAGLVGNRSGGLAFGVSMGVFWALAYGGQVVLTHFTLRFVLARYHYLPFRLVPFLDYATDRLFLRRVGGGYIFVHRLLRDYFAALYTEE